MFRRIFKRDRPPPAEPAPRDLFRSRGDERLQQNDYNGAVVMYDEAARSTQADTTLLLSRSFAHMMSTPPRLDLALQDADAAIQHDPISWKGWMQKGETYLRMGINKAAEEAFVHAVGFAQGADKLTAERSLVDARSRLSDSGPSVASTPLTPPPKPAPQPAPQPTPSLPTPSLDTRSHSPAAPANLNHPIPEPETLAPTSGDPPRYTANPTNPIPANRILSPQAVITQLTQFQNNLATRNKGSISIRPYASAGRIDAVQLVYVGMTQLELTSRELGTPTYQHSSFRTMAVSALDYPGSTFLDMDCESSGYYDGKLPGTISITGYSEEYRAHQLSRSPLLNVILQGTTTLPTMALDKIVDRIRLLRRQPTLEDNETLRNILGLSQLSTLQSGFNSGGRQRQIEAICMALNRSIYDAPTRFIDFSKARNISNNTLAGASQGIGLQNFLFQILLGAELLIRLRKEPVTTSYACLISDSISALVVLSALWMANVTIQGPRAIATTPSTPTPPQYLLIASEHQQKAEGLIRFGELLSWPYMEEARNYIEGAYQDLISGRQVVGLDICDWLFGLILPGKIFRHRIMCCLVYASPSIRSLNSAPFWDNGLVVKNKSYWPKRSVLGRVLGGLKNPRSVCGWIGPVPAPEGGPSGWIRLNARSVNIPVPVSSTQTSLQSLGLGDDGTESPEAILQSLADPNEWIQGTPPSRLTNDSSRSVFRGIHLTEIPSTTSIAATDNANSTSSTSKEYRASLEFEVNGTRIRYTLYSNPIFVSAPPCVGTHTIHRRQAQNYLSRVIKVKDLKEADAPSDTLVIIDALGEGEEVVARAWCAERARNAVIRRDAECCFACATGLVAARTGLGFHVLIWSR